MEKATLIILAGGKSSRFGRDKSLLELDGKRIVEVNVEMSRPHFDEVMISSNAEAKFGIPGVTELTDTYKEMGPMGGMHSGLTASRNDTVFFAACDMPYFNVSLAMELLRQAEGHMICVPRYGDKTEPLFGVYRKELLPLIEELLDDGRRSLRDLMVRTDTLYFDCSGWMSENGAEDAFYNINYQEDFEKVKTR